MELALAGEGCPFVVLKDVRSLNEVALVRRIGGVVVGVERPGLSSSPILVDTTIVNDGDVAKLHTEIEVFMNTMFRVIASGESWK
jgi:hypothetical protein